MRPRLFALLVAVLVLAGLAPRAEAAPMHTPLTAMRQPNVTVVIGVVHQKGGAITLDVDKVLQGSAALGTMTVAQSPDGHIDVDDERVVAFLDNGALRWIGQVLAGPSLETGVLKVRGFFDFNAHIVGPGVLSLTELVGFLKTGTLVQKYAMTLAFHDAKGVKTPSSKSFTLEWDALARTAKAPGIALACLGAPQMFPPDWGSLTVWFSDTCPSAKPDAKSRSLRLEGKPTGWNAATGSIEAELVPSDPYFDEKEYDRFVADGTLATARTVVRVTLADGSKWTWHVGEDLVDAGRTVHKAGGVSSSLQVKNGVSSSEDVYDFSGPKLVITPSPGVGSPGGNARGVVPMIDAGTVKCALRRAGVSVPCTLSHEPSVFLPR